MQVEIKARHFSLKDEQRETIEAALGKLEKFIPRPVQSFKVTLDHDAGRFVADGVLYLKNAEFRAESEGVEPEYAVNELVENLKKQLTRFKGKISGKQKGEEGGLGKAQFADLGALEPSPGATEGFVLQDLDVVDAKERFASSDLPFLVFRNVATARVGVIYRRPDGDLVHMESSND